MNLKDSLLKTKDSLLKVKASIVIFVILILAYFFLSNGSVFIPVEKIFSFAFSITHLENIFSFIIIHENLFHLAVNAIVFLGYAVLVELAIGTLDLAAIFVFSTIASALIFVFFNPNVSLIGSSIGVSALVASSIILNPKKAIALTFVLGFGIFFIAPMIFSAIDAEKAQIQSEQISIENELKNAVEQNDFERQIVLAERKAVIEQKVSGFESNIEFAEETPVNSQTHAMGAFFGMLYLLLFRRKKFNEGVRKILHLHFVDFDKHKIFK
ncbi:MAG: rhomboid family intramembrane serine protease [archaeon]|nr:rhomboid family intramembrane serine protease [archaeon]